jgi:hypothetical protein
MVADEWVKLIAAGSVPLTVLALIVNRIWTGKGIGVRVIQFLAVAAFASIIVIVALEKVIDGSAVAALIGTLVGYLFANIAEFDRRSPDARSES